MWETEPLSSQGSLYEPSQSHSDGETSDTMVRNFQEFEDVKTVSVFAASIPKKLHVFESLKYSTHGFLNLHMMIL